MVRGGLFCIYFYFLYTFLEAVSVALGDLTYFSR